MSIYILLLIFIPVLIFGSGIAWQLYYRQTISWQIFGGAALITIVIGVIMFGGSMWSKTSDTEIWNGQVVSKERVQVSCEHDYKCRCRQVCRGTGKDKSCSEECDTCYEHSYDVNSNLNTSVGQIKIARVDRQGVVVPPRWQRAAAGDPVAASKSYENLLKGSEQSLFKTNPEIVARYKGSLPPYPDQIYDYHHLDRAIAVGMSVPDLKQWSQDLSMRLRNLGPTKQVNVIVIFSPSKSDDFADALNAHWQAGKKNDVILVIGSPEYPKIEWVRVLGWTNSQIFNINVRDKVLDLEVIDRSSILNIVEHEISTTFQRRQMKDFEYLRSEIHPSTTMLAIIFSWMILSSIYGTIVGMTGRFNPFSTRY